MYASLTQITLLALVTLSVLGLSVYAYYQSLKYDKIWFFTYSMMLMILVQWMSDTGASLTYQNYYLHLASISLYPSIIFSLIVVYIVHGIHSAKQMLHTMLVGVIGYMASIAIVAVFTPSMLQVPLNFSWIFNHIFSSLALYGSYLILIFAWPILHNKKIKLPILFKIWAICWLLLIIDSVIFNLGTFATNPNLSEIMAANIVVRTTLSIFISPLIAYYIYRLGQDDPSGELTYRSWTDITKGVDTVSIKKIDELEKLKSELISTNTDLENQGKALTNLLEDIEHEKDLVQKQAESLRLFEAAASQSNEMMVFTDAEGIVLWANKSSERITGYANEDAIGRKAGVLWGKLMPTNWYKNLWDTVKISKKLFVGEILNHRKNGEKFWSSIAVYPILDEDGNVISLVSTQRDITKEKQIDQMKTEFISLASHQLRTPLSAMKWFLEMLLTGDMGKLTSDQQKAIENIDKSNERMIALVNGLLNISRIESGRILVEPKPTDPKCLVEDVIHDLKGRIEQKNQQIKMDIDKDIPLVNLDPKLISQVIMNFISNALKYSSEKSTVEVSLCLDGDELTFSVKDSGFGIPETEQEKIFTRFFRATNIQKLETDGTGLGLYLAKIIIESAGGKIWFKSKEGQGSTFTFSLPLSGMKPKDGEVKLT